MPAGEVVTTDGRDAAGPLLRFIARGRWALAAAATAGLVPQLFLFVASLVLLSLGSHLRGGPLMGLVYMVTTPVAILCAVSFALASLLTLALPPHERFGAPEARPFPSWDWLTVGHLRRAILTGLGSGLLILAAALAAATTLAIPEAYYDWPRSLAVRILFTATSMDDVAALGLALGALLVGFAVGRSGEGGRRLAAARGVHPPLPRISLVRHGPEASDATVTAEPMATSADAPCPVCGVPVGPAPVVCPRCGTPHHFDCHEYAGGCAIFGCRAKERPSAVPSSVVSPSSSPRDSSALSRRVASWLTLYRAHWAALCTTVAGVVLLSWFTALPLSPPYGGLVQVFGYLGSLFESAGLLLAGLGLPSYFVLLALETRQRHGLGEVAAVEAPPSGRATRALVDRLDPVAPGFLLHGLLAVLALGSATLAVLNLLAPLAWWWVAWGAPWAPPLDPAPLSLVLLVATGFPLALLHASMARAAHVRSLQNRLAASLKQKGTQG